MRPRPLTVRLVMVVSAAVFLGIALAFRFTTDGMVRNASGTALYASMVYAATVFVSPRVSPWLAGTIAILFCWLVEISQLTGVPAYLSARSLIARLVLGVAFDPEDMVWYPLGVLPLVAAHIVIKRAVAVRHPDR